jgi:hypothetical protein
MVRVVRLSKITISEREEEQIELFKEALEAIKYITANSLADAQKKSQAATALSKAKDIELEIISSLTLLEKVARDFTLATKNLEASQRIRTSVPFLTKYKVEDWISKLIHYTEEDNFALVKRTIEEEMLDPHFGMIAGRYEHTKIIEQCLPEEELNDALAYNNALDKLREVINSITSRSETAKYKEGFNREQQLNEFKLAVQNLLGKGFWLWRKGLIPEVENIHKKDVSEDLVSKIAEKVNSFGQSKGQAKTSNQANSQSKISSSNKTPFESVNNSNLKVENLDLSESELKFRVDTLKKLEQGLMKVSQLSYILLESNISSTFEQLEYHKKDLAETLVRFQARAVNLIVPVKNRASLRDDFSVLSDYYGQINKISKPKLEANIDSDVPEFAFEYFLAMENLAKDAQLSAEKEDYKSSVSNLEEIYRLSIRRDWDRLKKMKDGRSSEILLQRNLEIQEAVQEVRGSVRNKDKRDKLFTQLVLILEQTNQLLAGRKGN